MKAASSALFTVSSTSLCLHVNYDSPISPPFFFSESHRQFAAASTSSSSSFGKCPRKMNLRTVVGPLRSSVPSISTLSLSKVLDADSLSTPTFSGNEMPLPKTDRNGRFSNPRAARELALLMLYASCLEGSDPVRLFDKRVDSRIECGFEFNEALLLEYNHMTFGGPPVTTDTLEDAEELLRLDKEESEIEADVLSAPLKLVYSKLILRFTRKLLVAVVEMWDSHVAIIDKVVPQNWKIEPAGRILELSILHLAMSEIKVVGTRHQIVINEAVDLAKRFCDGAAPRMINGCLRTYIESVK